MGAPALWRYHVNRSPRLGWASAAAWRNHLNLAARSHISGLSTTLGNKSSAIGFSQETSKRFLTLRRRKKKEKIFF